MKFKKFTSILFVCVLIISCSRSLSIFANTMKTTNIETNTICIEPNDYGNPIQEHTYLDEKLDVLVTERIYFVPDQDGVISRDKSGNGWYKNEKTFTWVGGKTTTYYAKGYFIWGDGDVSVSNASGGYDYLPSNVHDISTNTDSGTGRFAGIFNKYAYVTYELSLTNGIGIDKDFSVTIKVSESGNVS